MHLAREEIQTPKGVTCFVPSCRGLSAMRGFVMVIIVR